MDDYGGDDGGGGGGGRGGFKRRKGGGMNQLDEGYRPERGDSNGVGGGRGGKSGGEAGGGGKGSQGRMSYNRIVPKFLQQYSTMLERPQWQTEDGGSAVGRCQHVATDCLCPLPWLMRRFHAVAADVAKMDDRERSAHDRVRKVPLSALSLCSGRCRSCFAPGALCDACLLLVCAETVSEVSCCTRSQRRRRRQ